MNYIREIIYRLRAGESERQIARDMEISRPTIHKYKELAEKKGYLDLHQPLVDEEEIKKEIGPSPKPPRAISSVEPYRDYVVQMLEKGVEMMAIWQRLRDEKGYRGSYSSLRRFVNRIKPEEEPESFVRVHTKPGEEMQVDFGTVGKLYDPKSGKIRTAYVFVATLSYSRHQYAEIVIDQKIPTWIGLHRRSFEYFEGVPQVVVPDNLKAAVIRASLYDPVLGEAYRRMAQHYGFLIRPTRPRTPQHKGKVENGVHYVQRNFMAGRSFENIGTANRHLKRWIVEIAGVRQHGTTKEAPLERFRNREKQELLSLPKIPFSLNEIRMAKVHQDCHVQVNGSYYSIPYRYVGQKVTLHLGEKMLEAFDSQQNLISTHVLTHKKGQWSTRLEDYPSQKADYLLQTPDYCQKEARKIGPSTASVVEHLLADQPLQRLRSVQGVLRLQETVGKQRLEAACKRALYFDTIQYRQIKEILNTASDREPLPESPAKAIQNTSHRFARNSQDFFC